MIKLEFTQQEVEVLLETVTDRIKRIKDPARGSYAVIEALVIEKRRLEWIREKLRDARAKA